MDWGIISQSNIHEHRKTRSDSEHQTMMLSLRGV